jgi:hypothetical protein
MADEKVGKPTALSVVQAAKVLSQLSRKTITVEMIKADIASGAPANRDGSINVVHYAAWLAREESNGRH